jgi:cell division protein FtsB
LNIERLRPYLPTAALSVAIFYFAFHMLTGEQGVLNWMAYAREIKALKTQIAEASTERHTLEIRARALNPRGLDMDLVDERARAVLGYADPREFVVQVKS